MKLSLEKKQYEEEGKQEEEERKQEEEEREKYGRMKKREVHGERAGGDGWWKGRNRK